MKHMSLTEIKRAHEANGGYFFREDTMKYWGTKLHGYTTRYNLFITSDDNFNGTKKLFSVRFYNAEKDTFESIFQKCGTLQEAQKLRNMIVNDIIAKGLDTSDAIEDLIRKHEAEYKGVSL